jgi:hypothetical protein
MYKVNLRKYVFGTDGGGFSTRLVRRIEMAFPPTPQISLGLYEWSEPAHDESRVERVMFNAVTHEFHVEMEPSRCPCPRNSAAWLVEPPAVLDLGVAFDTAEEADGCDPGVLHVVEIDGRFYPLDESDMWVLKQQATEFRYVANPGV